MKNPPKQSEPKNLQKSIQIIHGKRTETPLNVAIVGGGKTCHSLLQILDEDRLSRLKMKILGVADVNPEAPGFRYAKDLNLFTTTTVQELFTLDGLNLIIELTGSDKARGEILESKPPGVSFIDFRGARLLFDLVHLELEKTKLENESQQILDSLPYRIMVVNMDMAIEAVNRTFLRKFGLRNEDVLGKRCHEVRHALNIPCSEDKIVCFQETRLKELKKKGLISTYKEYTDENGNTRYDVITVTPILNEAGEVVQILEASRDVTDRFKLEEEVRKSNIFFQNVIQSTVDGIVVVDTKGNVLIFNEGMERLTGYPADGIVNKGHLSSFYDMDVARENMIKMRSDQFGPPGKLNPTSNPPGPDTPAREAANSGCPGGLAPGGGRAPAYAGGVGRPPLGRPLYPRASRPARRPGPHSPDAECAGFPPAVCPILAHPLLYGPYHAQPS